MSLRQMWTVKLEARTRNVFVLSISLVLAVVLLSGCENTPRNLPRMNPSSIGLTATFPPWGGNHSKAQVILTFTNPTTHPGTVVVPCPLGENAGHFASADKPTLVLVARDVLTQNEEGFVLTDWGKSTSGQSNVLTLMPGGSAQVPYALASFYSWGHAGPTRVAGFLDCLQPGEREVAVRALIAYSDAEPGKGEHIESPSVVLRCAFPDWLFKTKKQGTEHSADSAKDSQE